MPSAVIVAALRTPMGRYGGILSRIRPDDLAAHLIAHVIRTVEIDPAQVEDVYLGCANQAGEDCRNVARMALLLAGLPPSIPGATVNRLCGSGLEAVNQAARAIQTAHGDLFIAGGVENMSRAPWVIAKSETAFPRGSVTAFDCFALESHRKAVRATEAGLLKNEIVPVQLPHPKDKPLLCDKDEGPRPDTSLDQFRRLTALLSRRWDRDSR